LINGKIAIGKLEQKLIKDKAKKDGNLPIKSYSTRPST